MDWGVVVDNHDDETILVYFVVVLDFHAPVNVHAMARDRDGFGSLYYQAYLKNQRRDDGGEHGRKCASRPHLVQKMKERIPPCDDLF